MNTNTSSTASKTSTLEQRFLKECADKKDRDRLSCELLQKFKIRTRHESVRQALSDRDELLNRFRQQSLHNPFPNDLSADRARFLIVKADTDSSLGITERITFVVPSCIEDFVEETLPKQHFDIWYSVEYDNAPVPDNLYDLFRQSSIHFLIHRFKEAETTTPSTLDTLPADTSTVP